MKKVKVLFAWLLTFILLFVSSFVVSGEPDNNIAGAANAALPSGNMENICTKGDFTLFASMLTGEFAVRNNASGKIWYSNPADKENDPFAGTDKSKTFSLLALQYIEEDTLVQGFITGYEAQENGGVSVEKTDDGISVFYKYDDLRIAVPLDISLTDKGIKASINVKKIHEESNKKILNISMLPYFCAGNTKDDGYIVVPDGCGALIDFNSGRQDFASYSQPLYGRDVTVSGDTNTKQEENSALPLFGIKKGDMGFAAIITKGDAAASIVAGVSKKGSGYNNTYADFTLRSTDKVVISGNSMDVYEQNKSRLGSICVEYRLLSGDNADYTGIAKEYAKYLVDGGVKPLQKDKFSLVIETYGAVRVNRSVLGIPTKVTQPLTTFDEAGEIVDELKQNGAQNITLLFNDYDKSSVYGKLTKSVSPLSKLGGTGDLKKLNERLKEAGAALVSIMDITTYQNGFFKNRKSTVGLGGLPGVSYSFDLGTNKADDSIKPYYHLAPALLQKNAEKLAKKFDNGKYGALGLENFACNIYSDFSKSRPASREESVKLFGEAAKLLSKDNDVYMQGGASWAMPYTDYIYDMPSDTSHSDIESRQIPLYELAISGIIPYSLTAVNRSVEPDVAILKCAEYGGDIKYDFAYENLGVVGESELSYLNSTYYGQWKDYAAQSYKKLAEFSDVLCGEMLSHERVAENVYLTTYENGRVLVNYNEKAVKIGNTAVNARDFTVSREVN